MRSARPLSALGWDTDLKEYRPFLSHAELEAFFGKQSELHDLLASVLGLEDLANADKRLNAARKVREDELSNVKKRLEALRARVQPIAGQDERAQACLTALSGNTPSRWNVPGAEAAATGATVADGGALAALRGIAQLTPPARGGGRGDDRGYQVRGERASGRCRDERRAGPRACGPARRRPRALSRARGRRLSSLRQPRCADHRRGEPPPSRTGTGFGVRRSPLMTLSKRRARPRDVWWHCSRHLQSCSPPTGKCLRSMSRQLARHGRPG